MNVVQTVCARLRALSIAAGARRADNRPLVLLPHDCRRVFASEHFKQRARARRPGAPRTCDAPHGDGVQAKRQYFSDVAFGAAQGIVAGRPVTVGRGDGRFAVAPMAAPGAGGVGFTWIGNNGKQAPIGGGATRGGGSRRR